MCKITKFLKMTIPSYPLFVQKNQIVWLFFYVDISNWHLSITIDKVSVCWQFFLCWYFRWNYRVDVPLIALTYSWQIFQTVDEVDKFDKIDFFSSYFFKKNSLPVYAFKCRSTSSGTDALRKITRFLNNYCFRKLTYHDILGM